MVKNGKSIERFAFPNSIVPSRTPRCAVAVYLWVYRSIDVNWNSSKAYQNRERERARWRRRGKKQFQTCFVCVTKKWTKVKGKSAKESERDGVRASEVLKSFLWLFCLQTCKKVLLTETNGWLYRMVDIYIYWSDIEVKAEFDTNPKKSGKRTKWRGRSRRKKGEEATAKQYVNCCRTNKMNFDGFVWFVFSRRLSLRRSLLCHISNQAYRTIILFGVQAHSIFSRRFILMKWNEIATTAHRLREVETYIYYYGTQQNEMPLNLLRTTAQNTCGVNHVRVNLNMSSFCFKIWQRQKTPLA